MVEVLFQIGYLFISAVLGALANQFYNSWRRRQNLLHGLMEELKLNRERLQNTVDEINELNDWSGQMAEPLHTEAYSSMRVNDPTLLLRMRENHSGIFDVYSDINHYIRLSEATFTGEYEIPHEKKSLLVRNIESTKEAIEEEVEKLEQKYNP